MIDRFAISAELRRRGVTNLSIAERLGVTTRLVSYVIRGERNSPRVRRVIAHAMHRRVGDVWPANQSEEKTA